MKNHNIKSESHLQLISKIPDVRRLISQRKGALSLSRSLGSLFRRNEGLMDEKGMKHGSIVQA